MTPEQRKKAERLIAGPKRAPRSRRVTAREEAEARMAWRQELARKAGGMRRPAEEFVVQPNGQVRQAGATQAEDATVTAFKMKAQTDLFTFAFGVIDQWWLYPPLHQPICRWLQRTPPFRKALLVPREHCKSTLGCQAMPLHMIVQDAGSNVYLPGMDGTDVRILLAGETVMRAQDHLRVVADMAMNNTLLRALWPQIAWENPKRQSKKWNDSELIFPRKREFPDPTLRAIGVGGAVTGAHPPVMIKDDITTEAAANSPVVMQTAIRWHENIRALLAAQGCDPLEFIYGTRWAVGDLIDHIETNDPTVEVNTEWRQVTDGGAAIYPQNSRGDLTKFGKEGAIAQLQSDHGVMFWLLYMNSVGDSALVDFNGGDLREFEIQNSMIVLHEDDRDVSLAQAMHAPMRGADEPPGGAAGMTLRAYLEWEANQRASGTGGVDRKRLAYMRGARGRFEAEKLPKASDEEMKR